MTSRQLVGATLAGRRVPRVPTGPLAVHVTATLAGVSVRDYTLTPETMVDCLCRYHERFRPDAVWLSADTWVTAEAMGAAVALPGNEQPMGGSGTTLIQQAADIDRIPPADPGTRGRMPIMLEAMRRLRERLGDEVFIVGCFDQSPFSLACALANINQVMVKLVTDAPFVEALLERCVEHASAYALALGETGADLLSTGDSPAGLISLDHYRRFALPAERRVFESIASRCAVPTSLHICGNATHLLAAMATSGAEVLEIDHRVSLDDACRLVPEDITLWGNLDPINVVRKGSQGDVANAAQAAITTVRRHGRSRFVLSSGCTLAPDTPPENIATLCRRTWRP